MGNSVVVQLLMGFLGCFMPGTQMEMLLYWVFFLIQMLEVNLHFCLVLQSFLFNPFGWWRALFLCCFCSTLVKEGLFDIVKTTLESSDESIRLSGFVSTWMLCRKAHSICHGYIWGSLLSCLFGFSLVLFFFALPIKKLCIVSCLFFLVHVLWGLLGPQELRRNWDKLFLLLDLGPHLFLDKEPLWASFLVPNA